MSNERQTQKNSASKETKPINSFDGVVFTNPGDHIAPVFKRTYIKDIDASVVQKVDEFDLYEFIQASASQTDLAILQRRFVELGEVPNVDPNLQFGVDTSNLPSDIHGVYDLVNNVADNFNSLPESIKSIFGSSDAYLKAILDGTYQATLLNAINNAPKASTEEKKEGNE